MSADPGSRRNVPSDPTSEPVSDPVPVGDDVIDRDKRGKETPRRYEEPVSDPVLPADDSALNTQI